MTGTCSTCPYWQYTHNHDFEEDEEGPRVHKIGAKVAKVTGKKRVVWQMGECRLAPPVRIEEEEEWSWTWPVTEAFEWCGQHPDRDSEAGVIFVPEEGLFESDDEDSIEGTD